MIKILFELLEFLRSCAPLLVSLSVLTLFFILLSKSIKKHATTYYIVFALPFLLYLIPYTFNLFGIEVFSFNRLPVLGEIIRDYIHVGAFAHPILIIIMYVGALDPKVPAVKKLLSIRKEISILSGFPILTHSLVRVTNNFPRALKYFTNNAEYMENARVTSELGLEISNFSFVLGIVLLVIFIPLWITSFDSVHKRMGRAKWKKLQKWSYVLYALLFIHAMGIQVGGMLNPRGGRAPQPSIEATASETQTRGRGGENARPIAENRDRQNQGNSQSMNSPEGGKPEVQAGRQSSGGHGAAAKGISDIEVSRQVKQQIHITSLVLIYGSYLYLRLRKAKKDAAKKIKASA